jgi:hypothetical protein
MIAFFAILSIFIRLCFTAQGCQSSDFTVFQNATIVHGSNGAAGCGAGGVPSIVSGGAL